MRICYIDIDSCRADHLGCYGYSRNTSPNMDAIAKDGAVFRQFYTSDAPCLPSRTAFYSGRFGIQTGVVGHGRSAAQPKVQGVSRGFRDFFDEQGLARQLQKLGFHTAMISTFGQRHAAHWFYAGFNEIHNIGLGGMESAEQIWPVIDAWLKQRVDGGVANAASDNWFLHVNFWDPHTPYRVPGSYGNPFKGVPIPAHLDDDELIARNGKMVGPHTALDLGMYSDGDTKTYPREPARIASRDEMRDWIDGYDTGIRYADDYVGQIVARLKQAGLYDDTAIIISADHGENQGELGIYGEHATADRGTCHVPLIIKWPGVKPGQTCTGLQYNIDVAPTLMELLGGAYQPIWDGQSFAAVLKGGPAQGREQLVLSQCCHVCQRSVRWDDGGHEWLYMRTYHDGFHLFPQEMLYDLKVDPFEQTNVATQFPATCHQGAWRLAKWHDEQMQKVAKNVPHDVTDPLWTVMAESGPFHALHEKGNSPLPKYLRRLEATGRSEGADQLRRKYADFL